VRQFIRHPSDVPIQIRRDPDGGYVAQHTQNVGYGGLSFTSDTELEPESFISFRIPYLRPAFEVAAARVAWCRREGDQYMVGVQFPDSEEAFRVRMVEQICHIESYRREVEQREGRKLTAQEAAAEWISRYASSFPNP
jgi:PilZ domain-containing protein